MSTELSALLASTVNDARLLFVVALAGTFTKANWLAAGSTAKGALVPAERTSPAVRVAVNSAPLPAVLKITPVTVTVFVPAFIVPVTVPLIAPP
jgi:hypothetical protein